jgi:pantoate--beta-alanine ligase
MELIHTIEELQHARREQATAFYSGNFERPLIGLVPTMGALHAGHIVLLERMISECDVSIATVFVNPRQFNSEIDLETYPRTLDADISACNQLGVDILFAPETEEMYPPGYATTVSVSHLTESWCGAGRPGHFDGVATVVTKLFNITQPDRAYFGEKDYQQLQVVRRLVRDLNLNLDVVGVPTMREADGLAVSSRNALLTTEERAAAPRLYEALKRMAACFTGGVSDARTLRVEGQIALHHGNGPQFKLEYLAVVNPATLEERETAREGDRVLAAARLGAVRLIDNIRLAAGEVD